jgi:hypothetical protein
MKPGPASRTLARDDPGREYLRGFEEAQCALPDPEDRPGNTGGNLSSPNQPIAELHDWNSDEFLGFNRRLLGKKSEKNVPRGV